MVMIRIQERHAGEQQVNAVLSFNHGVEYHLHIQDPFGSDPKQETDLEWYFEEYLTFPFTQDVRAKTAAKSIQCYGELLFAQVFADTNALFAYKQARQYGLHTLQIEIAGSSAFHRLHWEALYDPEFGEYLALHAAMLRKNIVPQTLPAVMQPASAINILVVVARPSRGRDVGYRTISRPLMDELEKTRLPVEVTLLRPGTYQALVTHLERATREYGVGHYHLIHFDVHGALLDHEHLERGVQANRYLYASRFGRSALDAYAGEKAFLFLEGERDEQFDPVEATELAKLLLQHQIPIALLNACQSGKLSGEMETSLGNQLIQAGVQTVVAMGYSVTVSAAEVLMQSLYQALFEKKSLPEALCLARQALANQKERRVFFNQIIELEDWLLPILYQNQEVQFALQPFTPQEEVAFFEVKAAQYRAPQPTYGFVGRDIDILQIEKRLLLKRNLLLVRSMGGAGKTTLLHHLASWWQRTGLVHEVFYFGYDEKAWNRQQIMHTIARKLLDKYELLTFQSMSQEAQQARLAQLLKSTRHLLILDNLESVTGAPLALRHTLKPKEREMIRRFLSGLVGAQTLVLLGSRSTEEWLAKDTFEGQSYKLSGLDEEAASHLAERILERHGATKYRSDSDLSKLLKLLDGFPLALEVILANLEQQTPTEILVALQKGNTNLHVGSSEESTENILHCVDYSYCNLSPDIQQLLLCLAPFASIIWKNTLDIYVEKLQQQPALTALPFERWAEMMQETENWGLLSSDPRQPPLLHIQPVLPYFLRRRLASQKDVQWLRAAVEKGFYEYYVAFGDSLLSGILSKQAQERLLTLLLIRYEYENIFTALQFALLEKRPISALHGSLSRYLEFFRDSQQGYKLDQLLLTTLESNSLEEMTSILQEEWLIALGTMANRQISLRQYEAAIDLCQRMLDMLDKSVFDKEAHSNLQVGIYSSLGYIAWDQQEWEQANWYYWQVLQIEIKDNNRYKQANTHLNLGNIAGKQRQWEKAEQHYQQAMQIYIEDNDRYEQARIYHQLGIITQEQKQWGLAEQYYEKALQIYDEYRAYYEGASIYHNLGALLQQQEEWEFAEQCYQQALQMKIDHGYHYEQASTYHHLGIIAQAQKQWEQAKNYYQQALQIRTEYQDRYAQAATYHQLGKLAQEQQKWNQAEQYYQQALQNKYNDHYAQASTYHGLGMVAQEQQQWEQAEAYYLQVLHICMEYGNDETLAMVLGNLAHLWLVRKETDLVERVASILELTPLGLTPDEIEKLFREVTNLSPDQSDEAGS